MKKTNKKTKRINNLQRFLQKGQASRLLLVLAIIVLVAVVIVYLVIRMAERPSAPTGPTTPEVPQPVYEATLGNVKFVFMSAIDRGNVLKASEVTDTRYYGSWQNDLNTTERFIEVTIGAQNKGKSNILDRSWDIENIVDADGRNYEPLNQYAVQPWMPQNNSCGVLLKPEFEPVPCIKIYEVSKISTGLKIRVLTGKNNDPNNLSSKNTEEALIDLIVK